MHKLPKPNFMRKLTQLPVLFLLEQRCTNKKTCAKKILSCLSSIPGRPRATKPTEIASLMPLLPNVRDQGKTPTPQRAENLAPDIAVCPPSSPHNDPPYHDLHDAGPNIVMRVPGRVFALQAPTDDHIKQATQRVLFYAQHLFRRNIPATEPTRLTESLALADANEFQFTTAQAQRDIQELRRLGSLDALIVHHNNKQKDSGLNETRVITNLSDDEQFPKILDKFQNGEIANTDRRARPPFRDLQCRLTPMYNKHAATMHTANRVLILPVDQLTESERADLHMANEYHWRAEPGKVAGLPLMGCSNAQLGIIPLNTETTKQLGIARFQTVVLPNLREVVTAWEEYRRINALEWSDMWMFKADISNCFNQLHWHSNTVKLMGFMLTTILLMLMLTCGFGVAVTPMVWAVIGDALNRKTTDAHLHARSLMSTIFSVPAPTTTQQIVHDTINAVKKNIHAQTAEILGILIDLPTATMRPKDNAIKTPFYVLFSVDAAKPQPLAYWQCLAPLTNLYSQVLHGMRLSWHH